VLRRNASFFLAMYLAPLIHQVVADSAHVVPLLSQYVLKRSHYSKKQKKTITLLAIYEANIF
jgi:hypothetical protein